MTVGNGLAKQEPSQRQHAREIARLAADLYEELGLDHWGSFLQQEVADFFDGSVLGRP